MTQPQAPPPDRGALRAAIEGLLRTCVDLERQADGAATDARKRVRGVAETVAAVRLPRHVLDVPALAQQVEGLGRQLDADLRGRLAEARQPYVTEIHALLALLAPWHGLAGLPPLVRTSPMATLRDHFPPGFAQHYVADLLTTVDRSRTIATQPAAGLPVPTGQESDEAKARVAGQLPDSLREDGLQMLRNSDCHAVERHGHHLTAEAQLARLLLLKDPAGDELWRLLPTGGAESDHWCGPASGGFTSPAAMAKPLGAFLRWAHDHAGGVNQLINKHTTLKTKRFGIHVSAELAGLVFGDTAGFRGTATGSPERVADWRAARAYAMRHGAPPVYGVPYDPIKDGHHPGVVLAFKRTGPSNWHLVTCYPVEDFNPKNERLEDLT